MIIKQTESKKTKQNKQRKEQIKPYIGVNFHWRASRSFNNSCHLVRSSTMTTSSTCAFDKGG